MFICRHGVLEPKEDGMNCHICIYVCVFVCVYMYIYICICILSNTQICIHAHTVSLCIPARKISLEERSKKSRKTLKMQKHTGYQSCVKEKQFSVPLCVLAFKRSFSYNNRLIQGY